MPLKISLKGTWSLFLFLFSNNKGKFTLRCFFSFHSCHSIGCPYRTFDFVISKQVSRYRREQLLTEFCFVDPANISSSSPEIHPISKSRSNLLVPMFLKSTLLASLDFLENVLGKKSSLIVTFFSWQ